MPDILLVDDERTIREGLKRLLLSECFSVRTAKSGPAALAEFAESRPDLVLLDVMMPKMSGFAVCEEIRRRDAAVPVIFLTAKDSEADQVRGLGLGADDYISKSAGEAGLIARIRRALARAQATSAAKTPPVLALGRVKVDFERLEVSEGGRRIAVLTKTEADILKLLNVHRGKFLTPARIVAALRGEGFACEDGLVYTHVSHLRAKLGSAVDLIANERRLGYRLLA